MTMLKSTVQSKITKYIQMLSIDPVPTVIIQSNVCNFYCISKVTLCTKHMNSYDTAIWCVYRVLAFTMYTAWHVQKDMICNMQQTAKMMYRCVVKGYWVVTSHSSSHCYMVLMSHLSWNIWWCPWSTGCDFLIWSRSSHLSYYLGCV